MNLARILSLATFLVAIVPVIATSPVQAKTTPTFSCSIVVFHSPSTSTFYIFTNITATGGYLPSPEQDYLQSYHAGLLINSQSQTDTIPNKSTTFRFSLAVSDVGPGSYSWVSTVLAVKGHSFTQLAQCVAYYTL